jgi:hypothetical protein
MPDSADRDGARQRRRQFLKASAMATAALPALPCFAGRAFAAEEEDEGLSLPEPTPAEAALSRGDWAITPGALRPEDFGGGPGRTAADNGGAFAAMFKELVKRKQAGTPGSVYIGPGTYDLDRSFSPSGLSDGYGDDASGSLIVFDNVVLRVPEGASAGQYLECKSHEEKAPGVRRSLSDFRMRRRESFGAEPAAAIVDGNGRGVVKHCFFNLRNTQLSSLYGRLTLQGPARQVRDLVAVGNSEPGNRLNAGNSLLPFLLIRGFEIGLYGTPLLDARQDVFPDLLKATFIPQLFIEDVERSFVLSHNKGDMANIATAAFRQRLTSYLFATQLNIGTAFLNAMKANSNVDMIELNEATLNVGQLYCHTPRRREGGYTRYWFRVGNDSTLVCGSLRVDINTQNSGGSIVFVGTTQTNDVPCEKALVDVVSFNRNSRAKTLASVVTIEADRPSPRRRQILVRASDGAADLAPVSVAGQATTEDRIVLMTADTWGTFGVADGRMVARQGCW